MSMRASNHGRQGQAWTKEDGRSVSALLASPVHAEDSGPLFSIKLCQYPGKGDSPLMKP